MTGRVVDFSAASTRRARAEANKQQLLDEGRQRAEAARAAAASTVPAAQQRGYARYLTGRDTEQAREAWQRGQVIPHRITLALDICRIDGPGVDEACGVKEPAVDMWECGRLYPTWEQLCRLAQLTGFPVAFFTAPLASEPPMLVNVHRPYGNGRGVFEAVRQERPVPAFTQSAIRRTLGGRP